MGLNENVTYNIMKEKELYRDTLEFTEKSSEALSHEAPKRKHKQKYTKRNSRFQKQNNEKTSNAPSGSQESASWKFVKQFCKLLQLFLHLNVFKVLEPCRWDLCYCLKEVMHFQFYKQPPLSERWSKCFSNFKDFLS